MRARNMGYTRKRLLQALAACSRHSASGPHPAADRTRQFYLVQMHLLNADRVLLTRAVQGPDRVPASQGRKGPNQVLTQDRQRLTMRLTRSWFRAAFRKSNKVSRLRSVASLGGCYVLAGN